MDPLDERTESKVVKHYAFDAASPNTMNIISRVQAKCIEKGWRWQERIMKDGTVVLHITQCQHYNAFERCPPLGWGRFRRSIAWQAVENFIDEWDSYAEYEDAGFPMSPKTRALVGW